MSNIPPEHFAEFVEAYLGDRVITIRQESSHYLIKGDGLERPVLIDFNFETMPDRILNNQLRLLGLTRQEFETLAGTKKLLKEYKKSQAQEQAGNAS